MKWTAPADDGGSPITAFRVVILKTGTEIISEIITDPSTTGLSVGGLEMDTEYSVKVFARNAVFEGPAGEKKVKTKYEGNKMGCLVVGCFAYHLSFDDESSSNENLFQARNERPSRQPNEKTMKNKTLNLIRL